MNILKIKIVEAFPYKNKQKYLQICDQLSRNRVKVGNLRRGRPCMVVRLQKIDFHCFLQYCVF